MTIYPDMFSSYFCKLLFTKKRIICYANLALVFIKQGFGKPEREHQYVENMFRFSDLRLVAMQLIVT